jgi:hypothetical protein
MERSGSVSVITIAVLAGGGLIAGCGSSSVPALRTTGAISKAEATPYANAVNLGVADVPGMTSGSLEGETTAAGYVEFRCPGDVSGARRVVRIHSPAFFRGEGLGYEAVESEVVVWPTAALAARNRSAFLDTPGRACVARHMAQAADRFYPDRVRTGPAAVSFPRSPQPSVYTTFRVTTPLIVIVHRGQPGVRTRVYVDNVGLVVGPAEIRLRAEAVSRPPPLATERRLLSLLYSRAKT